MLSIYQLGLGNEIDVVYSLVDSSYQGISFSKVPFSGSTKTQQLLPSYWTNFRQHPRAEIGRSRIVSGQITRIPKSELRSFWGDSHYHSSDSQAVFFRRCNLQRESINR